MRCTCLQNDCQVCNPAQIVVVKTASTDTKDELIKRLKANNERLQKRVVELEEVLRFYANAGPIQLASDIDVDNESIMSCGRRAKQALAAKDGV